MIQDLLNRFSSDLDEILLVGSSAGGIGVINNVNWTRGILPNTTGLKVLLDSSWFINFHGAIEQELGIKSSAKEKEGEVESLLEVLRGSNPACQKSHTGVPCCISARCLLTTAEYYPQDVPTLSVFGLYDIYLLSYALEGVEEAGEGSTVNHACRQAVLLVSLV